MGTTADADRRDPNAPRRPFLGTVDLSAVDHRERFQADAIDLSAGGMSLRAQLLPAVGERLAFQFALDDGRPIDTTGEVVWARGRGDAGAGSFGVRFLDLSADVRAALGRATKGDDVMRAADGTKPREEGKVKMFIAGMDAPLRARVRARTDGGIVLGSDLSFLKLGDQVSVEGSTQAAGYIDSVDVEIDPRTGIPRLILTIDTEGRGPKPAAAKPAEKAEPPAAKPVIAAATVAPVAVVAEPVAPTVRAKSAEPVAVSEAQAAPAVEAPVATKPAAALTAPAVADARRAEVASVRTAPEMGEDDDSDDDLDEPAAPGWLTRSMATMQGAMTRARDVAGPAMARARDAAGGAATRLRGALQKDAPGAEERAAGPRLRPQHVARGEATEGARDSVVTPLKNKRVVALAAMATALTVGVVAVAVGGGPRTETPRPQVNVSAEAPASAAPATEAPESIDLAAEAPEGPAAPLPQPRVLAAQGTTLPADLSGAARSPMNEGPAAAPVITQRVVRRAAPVARAAAPGSQTAARVVAPAARPVAAPAARVANAAAGPVLGPTTAILGNNAVRAGTTLRLRMDGPIGTLRGPGAQGAAIVVSLPGRRSLDTAGGFAQRDPRVVSAAINNRPGGAELTLRFRTPAPPFVARARGQTLEVILGPTPGAAPVRTARR